MKNLNLRLEEYIDEYFEKNETGITSQVRDYCNTKHRDGYTVGEISGNLKRNKTKYRKTGKQKIVKGYNITYVAIWGKIMTPRDEDIIVRTRIGNRTLEECRVDHVFVLEEKCIVCGENYLVSLNNPRSPICDDCHLNRKKG